MKVRKVQSLGATARAVQKVIGYDFRNPLLLQEAFQAPGLHQKKGFLPLEKGHKRLASVGDAVLHLLVKERLYHLQMPVDARYSLAKRLVCNANLSVVFKRLNFEKYLRVVEGKNAGDQMVTADAMEGIIGAVYLDSGIQPTLQVCTRIGLIPRPQNLRSEYNTDQIGSDILPEDQDVESLLEKSEGAGEGAP